MCLFHRRHRVSVGLLWQRGSRQLPETDSLRGKLHQGVQHRLQRRSVQRCDVCLGAQERILPERVLQQAGAVGGS